MSPARRFSCLLAIAIGWWGAASAADRSELLQALKLPPGFHIEIAVDDVPGARSMALAPDGTLFVGTETPGRVLRVGGDGKAFMLLDTPYQEIHTLRFDDKGALFVGAVNGRTASMTAPAGPLDTGNVPPAGDAGRAPVPTVSVSTEITSIGGVDTSGATTSTSPR